MSTYFKLAMILLLLHPLASSTESLKPRQKDCFCSRDCDPDKGWQGSKDKKYVCGLPLKDTKSDNKGAIDVLAHDWKCYLVPDYPESKPVPEKKGAKSACPMQSIEFVSRVGRTAVATNNACALGLTEVPFIAPEPRLVLL